jgi:methionyl-tRNA synthetase
MQRGPGSAAATAATALLSRTSFSVSSEFARRTLTTLPASVNAPRAAWECCSAPAYCSASTWGRARRLSTLPSSSSSLPSSPSPSPSKPFLITTPIYYVNSAPHLGHLYTSVLADATARYHSVRAREARLAAGASSPGAGLPPPPPPSVLFSTGTDEHGQKVADAARAAGAPDPLPFCDSVSSTFRCMSDTFSVGYTSFVRTTAPPHAAVVAWLWRRLEANGHISLGQHEGYYCQSDETFLADMQVVTRRQYLTERGLLLASPPPAEAAGATTPSPPPSWTPEQLEARVSAESGHPVERVSETNYLFRLPHFRARLLALLDDETGQLRGLGPGTGKTPRPFVSPPARAALVRQYIESDGLRDLSVSRRRERVPWALPVPASTPPASSSSSSAPAPAPSEPHSVYVWLDALANYLTAAASGSAWLTEWEAASAAAAARGDPAPPVPDLPLSPPGGWASLFPAWPADVHVVGKDILKFHAAYWPAFCIGAGLPPPSRIVSHGHWTVERVKMSKSLGNVVRPGSLLQEEGGMFTPDAVRYFLLREGRIESDGDFNPRLAQQRCSKECADTFANLATRVFNRLFMPLGLATLAPHTRLNLPWDALAAHGLARPAGAPAPDPSLQTVEMSDDECALLASAAALLPAVSEALDAVEPGRGLEAVTTVLQAANKAYSDSAPWKRKPTPEEAEAWTAALARGEDGAGEAVAPSPLSPSSLRLAGTLYTFLEVLRVAAILLQPAMPTVAPKLLAGLGFDASAHRLAQWSTASPGLASPADFRVHIGDGGPFILFPKPPEALISQLRAAASAPAPSSKKVKPQQQQQPRTPAALAAAEGEVDGGAVVVLSKNQQKRLEKLERKKGKGADAADAAAASAAAAGAAGR